MDQGRPNTVDAADSAPDEAQERDLRCSMMQRCLLIDAFGRTMSCFLRNISRWGASARGCKGLRTGQKLTLVLPVIGEVDAIVRWVDGERFGLRLLDAIDPDLLIISGIEVQPKFKPMFVHQPTSDFRRPGFDHRRRAAVT